MSAGRPNAEPEHGAENGSNVVSGPVDKTGRPHGIENPRRQRFNGPEVIDVRVANRGRAPVAVASVALCAKGGTMRIISVDQLPGAKLPDRSKRGTTRGGIWMQSLGNIVSLLRATVSMGRSPASI